MTNLIHWNHNNNFNNVFDQLFDNFFYSPAIHNSRISKNITVKNQDDQTVISIAAPGLDKKDFNVELNDDHITISYDVDQEKENSFIKKSFSRTWSLPKGVDRKSIQASYKAGVLNIGIPKEKAKAPSTRVIKVS